MTKEKNKKEFLRGYEVATRSCLDKIEYILNKNSKSALDGGGINYEKAYREFEELEHYLSNEL